MADNEPHINDTYKRKKEADSFDVEKNQRQKLSSSDRAENNLYANMHRNTSLQSSPLFFSLDNSFDTFLEDLLENEGNISNMPSLSSEG